MWKNIVEPGRPEMKIWLVRIACWITKATNTHTQVNSYSLLFHETVVAGTRLSVTFICTLPVLCSLFMCNIERERTFLKRKVSRVLYKFNFWGDNYTYFHLPFIARTQV